MDNVTKAKINLFAVLRNIEDLCDMDNESKELIKNENISVQFNVPEVGIGTLIFKDGKCKFETGARSATLKLWFNSPEHFNKLVDGENTIPLFINVFKVSWLLKKFTKLAERLSYYLQPGKEEEKLLEDITCEYYKINTILTAYTAFFALCQVGNSDKVGKVVASRLCDGDIQAGITSENIQINLNIKNHVMTASKGSSLDPMAYMYLADLEFAHDLLNGKTSSYCGLGQGKFNIKGRVSMLDQMAKLLSMVSFYLK